MDSMLFLIIATALALAYSLTIRVIQSRLVDQNKIKEIQKRFNQINKDYLDAIKSGNKKKIEQMQAEQEKIMPEFNKLMGSQMRMMLVVIFVFIFFMAIVNVLDPSTKDDVEFELTASGEQWCGSYTINCTSPGSHGLTAIVHFKNEGDIITVLWNKLTGQETGIRTIEVVCGEASNIPPHIFFSGVPINITTDKKVYMHNDVVKVCVQAPKAVYSATGRTDSGTWFMVPLPFTIPGLGTQAIIYGAAPWFILVSLLSGVVFSFAINKIKGVKNDKKKR